MTAFLITRDYVDNTMAGEFRCGESYTNAELEKLANALLSGEGQPFILATDDWDLSDNSSDEILYRGRVMFHPDHDAADGYGDSNLLIAWANYFAGATKLLASPGDTSVPLSEWSYLGL